MRAHGNSYRRAAAIWFAAGIVCAGLFIFVFIGERLRDLAVLVRDPLLPTLVLAGAILALSTGSLLLSPFARRIAGRSIAIAVLWLIISVPLVFAAFTGPESGPRVSSSLIIVLGLAGAFASHRARRTE